ncbi:MAG TPA: carboxypeptidase-like regulatory domain-containing protein [Candidatus Limnocylindrales bacterium]|nr:carboxypeptidase-like regulatory domain-containing protein [Candidatus Limnocylindrales bacterium]
MAGRWPRRIAVACFVALLATSAIGAATPVLARDPVVAVPHQRDHVLVSRHSKLPMVPRGAAVRGPNHLPLRPVASVRQPGDLTGFAIKVADGDTISGTVTDGSDPIEGVFVIACNATVDQCFAEGQTGADGTFDVRGLGPGHYVLAILSEDPSDVILTFYSSGGPVDDPADATLIDLTSGDQTGIDIVPFIGHQISGSVHGTGNVALADVEVFAQGSFNGGFGAGGGAVTDLAGNFTIHALPDDDYTLSITIPSNVNFRGGPIAGGTAIDPAFFDPGDTVSVSGANVAGRAIIAPTGRRISGTLTGSEANGATAAALGTGHESGDVIVAANGHWQISGLWGDDYEIHFSQAAQGDFDSLPGLGNWNGVGPLSATASVPVTVAGTDRTGINASIPAGRTLSGHVTGSDGALTSPALVVVSDDNVAMSTTTGANGSWTIRHAPAGSFAIQAFEENHIGGYFGPGGFAVAVDLATTVTLGSAGRSGIDVVLPAGLGITGTVTGPDDQPIAGAVVVAEGNGGLSPGSSGGAITAVDGTFRLPGLGSDTYRVHLAFESPSDHLPGYYAAGSPGHFSTDVGNATSIALAHQGVGTTYVPIAPLRVVDSRTPLGVTGVLLTGVPKTFSVAGVGTIPADAVAVTGNVTAVGQTAAGYLALTPVSTANPTSSTINVPIGDVRANNFTVPLAGNGKLAVVWKGAGGSKSHVVVDITGYFLAEDTNATYAPLSPVRVMDTRPATHIGTPTTLAANVPQTLSVAGAHGIPADAVAVTGNLTVVGQTLAGYVSITPSATSSPTTSTLNFPVGDVRANGVSAQLNGSGDLSVVYKAPSGSANVILDITGYYSPDPGGLLFYPVPPGRAMDTRPGVLATGLTGAFGANAPREVAVAGRAEVPLDAAALTGNLTVTGQTAAGYAAITTVSTASPTTSTLNFPVGDVRANGVTVPLDVDGGLWLVYKAGGGKTTHLIFDVTGYYQ